MEDVGEQDEDEDGEDRGIEHEVNDGDDRDIYGDFYEDFCGGYYGELPEAVRELSQMPESTQRPLMESQQLDALVAQGNAFAVALAGGYRNLLRMIYDIEIGSGRASLQGGNFPDFLSGGAFCLAQTPSVILQAVIAGDVFERYLKNMDKELVRVIDLYLTNGTRIPGFYRMSLVDEKGVSPNVETLLRMLDRLERYCEPEKYNSGEDIAFASRMDRVQSTFWRPEWTKKGWRRYLQPTTKEDRQSMGLPEPRKGQERDRRPVPRKILGCQEYVKILRAKLRKNPDLTKPLPRPLSYTGWSKTPTLRIRSHIKTSSSRIMAATNAAYQTLFPQSRVYLQGIVLSFICEEEHAFLGEVIWTCVGQTNIVDGGGFNAAPSGESNDSLGKMHPRQIDGIAKWILDNTPMKANFAEQTKLLENASGEVETKEQKNWRKLRKLEDRTEVAEAVLEGRTKEQESRNAEQMLTLSFAIQALNELFEAMDA